MERSDFSVCDKQRFVDTRQELRRVFLTTYDITHIFGPEWTLMVVYIYIFKMCVKDTALTTINNSACIVF